MRSGICKLLSVLLLLSLTLTLLASCKKREYGHGELTIDLPREFKDHDSDEHYDACYSNGTVVVGILRVSFDAIASENWTPTMSPLVFAETYYKQNALSGIPVTETEVRGDVVWYTYSQSSAGGMSYTYMPTFYFSPYAYFIVTYILPSGDYEYKKETLLSYAESVRIDPTRVEKSE